ncbi:hypothetical protein PYCC9005_000303 [Savitreella phatthalungensis]
MRAIQVADWQQGPKFTESAESATPSDDSEVKISVLASGLHNLVRAQTSGKHYTASKTKLPYTAGADGVGLTPDGQLVYFIVIPKGGGFAETVYVPKTSIYSIDLPDDKKRDVQARLDVAINVAALFNPAMSSWMAIKTRVSNLPKDFTLVILGVTSISGQVAITLGRILGARKVIGVARSEEKMAKLDLDERIVLSDEAGKTDFSSLSDAKVDVVLDYVYGYAAVELLSALPSDAAHAHEYHTQYVNIGSVGSLDVDIPAALFRSHNLTVRGAGPGSWSLTKDAGDHFPELLKTLAKLDIEKLGGVKLARRRLEDAEEAFSDKDRRSVFVV